MMRAQSQFPYKLSSHALGEMLEPIAALIADPRDCDLETGRMLERLAYLVTRGPARDGRAEFLKSMSVSSLQLFMEDIRHDSGGTETNWWLLAQVLGTSPKEARALFPNWIKP